MKRTNKKHTEQSKQFFMGIDPGQSGAIVVIGGSEIHIQRLNATETDVADFVGMYTGCEVMCYLERVSAMPKQGVSSTFKFGTNYGFLRGLLVSKSIPFETVPPGTWQKKMRCQSGGDKNVTKSAAQQLFPDMKITHANADALLIAEYLRRVKTGELT